MPVAAAIARSIVLVEPVKLHGFAQGVEDVLGKEPSVV
jgi:hypothetical protein